MSAAFEHRPAHGGYPDATARLNVRMQRAARAAARAVGAAIRADLDRLSRLEARRPRG